MLSLWEKEDRFPQINLPVHVAACQTIYFVILCRHSDIYLSIKIIFSPQIFFLTANLRNTASAIAVQVLFPPTCLLYRMLNVNFLK